MKGEGSSVPGGIIVINLEMVKVLASIKVCAWDKSTPKAAWNFEGSTLAKSSEMKQNRLIIQIHNIIFFLVKISGFFYLELQKLPPFS